MADGVVFPDREPSRAEREELVSEFCTELAVNADLRFEVVSDGWVGVDRLEGRAFWEAYERLVGELPE